MTRFYGSDGLRTMIREREQRLLREAEQERLARKARRPVRVPPPAPTPRQAEVEWGPWLQGGEPIHLSTAGAGLS